MKIALAIAQIVFYLGAFCAVLITQIVFVLSAVPAITFAAPVDEAESNYMGSLGYVIGVVEEIKGSAALCNERFPEFASVNQKVLEAWIHRNSKTIDEINSHVLKTVFRIFVDAHAKRYLEKRRKEFSEVAVDKAKEICGTYWNDIAPGKYDLESVAKVQLEKLRKYNLQAPPNQSLETGGPDGPQPQLKP